MNEIVLDTSFLVALIDEKDKWHKNTEEILKVIKDRKIQTIVFDCVANECISVIGKRVKGKREEEYKDIVKKALDYIAEEKITKIYGLVEEYYSRILKDVINSNGNLSFHDILIVLGLEEINIPYLASFDNDFDKVERIRRIKDKNFLEVKK